MIPVVGQVLAAVIGLFDALVLLICGLNPPEEGQDPNPVCNRISGWIAYGVTWLIYSGNIMVDLEWEERLELQDFSQDFLDENLGIAVGNGLILEANVKSNARLINWEDTDFSALAGSYWWQYDDDNLRSTTFDYEFSDSENDLHEDLNRNEIDHSYWSPNEDGKDKYSYSAGVAGNAPLEAAGINRSIELYLNEGFAVPAQECWTIPNILTWVPPVIPVCYVRTERGSVNIDIGENMRYDVFPLTLDEFYDLTLKAGSGYALAWSPDTTPAFPVLQDADGDGLRSKSVGGADPDDSKWDTDGDGLSDYFEAELGSNPEDFDTDDDLLGDYDEVIHKTDINLADTDYDGLTDKEEIDGWEFVYDFAEDGSQLATWVTLY